MEIKTLQPSIQPPLMPFIAPTNIVGTGTGKLPSMWEKNLPRLAILVGSAATGFGAWWLTNVTNDPETSAMVGTNIDIPALCTAITGIVGIIGGFLKQVANDGKSEQAIAHVEAVSQAKIAQVETVAAVATSKASSMPPLDSEGKMTVEHSLDATVTLALSLDRVDVAEKILALRKSLPKGDENAA